MKKAKEASIIKHFREVKEVSNEIKILYKKNKKAIEGLSQYLTIIDEKELNNIRNLIKTGEISELIDYLEKNIKQTGQIELVKKGIRDILYKKTTKKRNGESTNLNGEYIKVEIGKIEKNKLINLLDSNFPEKKKAKERLKKYLESLNEQVTLKKLKDALENKPRDFERFIIFLENIKDSNVNGEFIEKSINNVL
ncbi:hypothetical protein CSB07_00045 [Candidatus Gracilibacteria bacterium]|nr:MAG: hypothetical protein CSB07_00045 [Candidatus Gracilibacteria bacterium]PIE85667.1 MAG: hypothetical protein CSA08_00790 [Candidatus Gracilibacteria bacterium]